MKAHTTNTTVYTHLIETANIIGVQLDSFKTQIVNAYNDQSLTIHDVAFLLSEIEGVNSVSEATAYRRIAEWRERY